MALIKCKECGKDVSRNATACPHCGNPIKKSSSVSSGCGCLIVLILGGIIVSAIMSQTMTSSGTSPSQPVRDTPPSKPTITLDATVGFDGTQFVIQNGDSFDWTDVELEINSKGLSSGYKLRTQLIEAGTIYTVGAMQFATKDGERFNPFSYKAVNLSIYCQSINGRGFYYGSWK